MSSQIPSVAEIQEALLRISHADMQSLAEASGVPFTTLWKMRSGETEHPRIDTVKKFWCHVGAFANTPDSAHGELSEG